MNEESIGLRGVFRLATSIPDGLVDWLHFFEGITMSMRVPLSAWLCVLLAGTGVVSAQDGLKSPIDFTRDIRPILSDNCFQCHGPDPGQREADLRLDTREGAFSEGETGTPFVSGKPGESEALHRLTSDDADLLMPPADSGKTLTKEQISLLQRWVNEGATWSKHWAFVPPKKATLPQVKGEPPVDHAVDAFVRARLSREKLTPSAKADKVTLLRRLSLDLIGIPPSIEEVDAFLQDARPDAYARQIERLLASSHHGERWGRHWLDAARYADSDGFEKDKPRQVWFYRDWVINALNRDLPYDQFVVQQIAGDLLPGATQEQIVATGFLRNSMINEEGGVDPEQFRMEAMFDRMDAVGKAVLGLTVQCGQCHSHKYDPFSQDDYYRMFAFLNNSHESAVTVYTPGQQQVRERVLKQIRDVEEELEAQRPD